MGVFCGFLRLIGVFWVCWFFLFWGFFLGILTERRINITTCVVFFFFLNSLSGFAVGTWQVPGPVKLGSGTRGHAELQSSLKLPEKFPLKLDFKGNSLLFIMHLFLQEIATFF